MTSFVRRGAGALLAVLAGALPTGAQVQRTVSEPHADERLVVLDVPYIAQSAALCGGAAVAMLLRYWGERAVRAEDFSALVTPAGDGIRAADLVDAVRARGWTAQPFTGDARIVRAHIAAGRPVIALIEVTPTTFHYVVLVAWAEDGVLLHDPALAPFRRYDTAAFMRAWAAAGHWSLLVQPHGPEAEAPTHAAAPADATTPASAPLQRSPSLIGTSSMQRPHAGLQGSAIGIDTATADCGGWLTLAIDAAQRDDLTTADRMLSSAAALCPGSARVAVEQAGLRFLQERYQDAAALAEAALERDAHDTHAVRLLGASRFMLGDEEGALDAWNLAGGPAHDLTTVDGLERMRFHVVADAIGIEPGQTVTSALLRRARRRVLALPAVSRARVDVLPREGELAEIDAAVVERPSFARAWPDFIGLAGRTFARRELELDLVGIAGAGERWRVLWRWSEGRPARAVSLALPGLRGMGVWELRGGRSTESYALPSLPDGHASTRRTIAVQLSDWASGQTAWTIGASADRWDGRGTFVGLLLSGRIGTADDLFGLTLGLAGWAGSARSFGRAELHTRALIPAGRSFETLITATIGHASDRAPADLWYGAGTGDARAPLLRAHQLLDSDDRISSDFFASGLLSTTIEVRRWLLEPLPGHRLGLAGFVDAAAMLRSSPHRNAIDAGAGARLRFGDAGTLRIDFAGGITERARAFSISFEPASHSR